jgi:hypothetical protein
LEVLLLNFHGQLVIHQSAVFNVPMFYQVFIQKRSFELQ